MSCNTEVETMTRQMKENLPASERIPKKLMQVIWKATEKEQSKRYQTALDFKHAIQAALLPEPSKSQQVMDWIQENAMMLLGGVMVLAVLIFVIVILVI
jgi:serine/threonine-protein kinase